MTNIGLFTVDVRRDSVTMSVSRAIAIILDTLDTMRPIAHVMEGVEQRKIAKTVILFK